jgi:hypothetical protein
MVKTLKEIYENSSTSLEEDFIWTDIFFIFLPLLTFCTSILKILIKQLSGTFIVGDDQPDQDQSLCPFGDSERFDGEGSGELGSVCIL